MNGVAYHVVYTFCACYQFKLDWAHLVLWQMLVTISKLDIVWIGRQRTTCISCVLRTCVSIHQTNPDLPTTSKDILQTPPNWITSMSLFTTKGRQTLEILPVHIAINVTACILYWLKCILTRACEVCHQLESNKHSLSGINNFTTRKITTIFRHIGILQKCYSVITSVIVFVMK